MSGANYTPLTPLAFLERASLVFPDKEGVVYGDRRLTYAEMATDATATARALMAAGVGPGDRVAYLCPNLPEMLIAHFAVPLAGAVLVAVNTRLSGSEIEHILQHSGAKVLVVDTELYPVVAPHLGSCPELTHVVAVDDAGLGVPDGAIPYVEFTRSAGSDALAWAVADENAAISINYTSGTTGRPKGVVYTHRGAYLNALGELIHSRHTSESVYLWTLPMFHCNGWCTTWAVTAIGGRHVCLRAVRPDEIWRLIGNEGVTHLNAAPTVLISMVNAPEAAPFPTPLVATTAGAPPSPTIITQMEALGARVVHVYGLTETYGPHTVCEVQEPWSDMAPEERARLMARQGMSFVTSDPTRVVDEDMADVPADAATMGEVVMRGNNVMAGYFEDPDATVTAFRGGWFHSGDLGVQHPDGYIQLRDRAKDIIISGGENISTIEVEQALMSHPAVLEAAVIAVPDAKWGERPKGFVILRAGTAATGDELIEHVRSRIARFKAPDAIEFPGSLPKTSTGKIQKYVLRQSEWAEHEAKIH
ncbi:MAG TPA: AMP-binding protein [Acidimicrobiia bacterium]